MGQVQLSIQKISKSFPGVQALNAVSFNIAKGSVHAIVGENGAGKSTLIKILAGIYAKDSGEIWLDGQNTNFKAPQDSQRQGIFVVHQELKLSETLSIAENIFLGYWPKKGRLVDWKQLRKKAADILGALGVSIDVEEEVSRLSVAQKQMVEIAKAINHQCKVLILDEPSATLTEHEQKIMFGIVKRLKSEGITIIYISHRLEEVFDLADEVTVLRDGAHVKTLPVSEVDRNRLIALMVGRELGGDFPRPSAAAGETVLEVKNLTVRGKLEDISFKARRGEILGIAGLVGAGRTELAHAILGILKLDRGEVLLHGKPVKHKDFREAVRNGFGLIPEDRKKQGLVQIANVKNNVSLASLKKITQNKVINNALEKAYANKYVEKLDVRASSIETEVQYLSGGNQQKVTIAKWLMADSELFILDEPTRGIDIGAKSEIYNLIVDLVDQGKLIIIISSELPEVIGLSDRILVMHGGKIRGEILRGEFSQEKILAMCV